jgi:anti-sigma regulatory factor (Ser/Thr protein kinase)
MTQLQTPLGPNLIQSISNFRWIMINVSSLLFWIPIFVFVSIEHLNSNFYFLTRIIPVLLLVYVFTFFIKNYTVSTITKLLIHLIFYILLIFFGDEIQSKVLAFGVIFLASILMIAFGLRLNIAIPLFMPVLILEFIVVDQVGDKLVLSGAAYNIYFFMLFHAIIGLVTLSFTHNLEKELRYIDTETIKIAAENRRSQEFKLQRDLFRSLRSKIHGTLLNNLSLISQQRFSPNSSEFIKTLEADLNDTKVIENALGDISLSALIETSVSIFSNSAVKIAVVGTIPNLTLTKKLSNDLSEILKEVLRNIERHANAKNVSIELILKNLTLKIRITDDGKGPDFIKANRIGTKSTILETLNSVGGEIFYLQNYPSGTLTEINFPTTETISLENLTEEKVTRRIFPNFLKFIFLFPYLVLAIFLIFDSAVHQNPIIYLLFSLVVIFLILSLFPDIANIKQIFPTLYLLFSLVFAWQMTKVYDSCSNAGGWNWIVTTFDITFAFYLAFQKHWVLRWAGLPIYILSFFLLSFYIPAGCQSVIVLPLINGLIAGLAFGLALFVFYKKAGEKITTYEKNYKSDNLIRANINFQKYTDSNWSIDPEPGLKIISDVTQNPNLLQNLDFLRQAKIEQSRLRSLLNIDPTIECELNHQILTTIRLAAAANNIFELEFHGDQQFNPRVPDFYFELVTKLVQVNQESPIKSKIFSSPESIQISLLAESDAFTEVSKNLGSEFPVFEYWTLETEKIADDGTEKIWFLLNYQRTSDELAHYVQASSIQTTNQ